MVDLGKDADDIPDFVDNKNLRIELKDTKLVITNRPGWNGTTKLYLKSERILSKSTDLLEDKEDNMVSASDSITVIVIPTDSKTGIDDNNLPLVTDLQQNYPNPFNNSTMINYSLKEAGNIKISLYNIKGEFVEGSTIAFTY